MTSRIDVIGQNGNTGDHYPDKLELNTDQKNSWRTDPLVFAALDKEFNFSLDIAADTSNALTEFYFTKDASGLDYSWSDYLKHLRLAGEKGLSNNVFINPPYGRGMIKRFMNKAIKEKVLGITSVLVVPAKFEAQWLPISMISEIRIITGGRLSFYHPITNKKMNGNTFGSMIVVFRPDTNPCFIRTLDRDFFINSGR